MGQEDTSRKTGEALLQNILKQGAPKNIDIVLKQMMGQGGLLTPLAATLSKLLEDPVLRQAVDSTFPPARRKDN